jgi:hypothetical protein
MAGVEPGQAKRGQGAGPKVISLPGLAAVLQSDQSGARARARTPRDLGLFALRRILDWLRLGVVQIESEGEARRDIPWVISGNADSMNQAPGCLGRVTPH